jgi:hypothetical protein
MEEYPYTHNILSRKEIVTMAKQLGMMHLLYAARGDFWELQTRLRLFVKQPEDYVFDSLRDEQKFYELLDKWDKRFKKDRRAFIQFPR